MVKLRLCALGAVLTVFGTKNSSCVELACGTTPQVRGDSARSHFTLTLASEECSEVPRSAWQGRKTNRFPRQIWSESCALIPPSSSISLLQPRYRKSYLKGRRVRLRCQRHRPKKHHLFATPRSRGVGTLRVGRPADYLPSGTVGQWPPATGQRWNERRGGDKKPTM